MSTLSTTLGTRLASLFPAQCIEEDPRQLATYAVDERIPQVIVKPGDAEQTAELVRFARAGKLAIIPIGSRSKREIGNPPSRYHIALDMTDINQIAHYDPGDLTLSADAGCSLRTIAAALTPQNQFLPLPDTFGLDSTVAGTIASGVDSHLRQFYGTARDFLVGAEFIDGTGEPCKSGGRVVKNVTGYDLHKLLIGSLGTLAIITRLNFRTFPAFTSTDSISQAFAASFPDATSAVAFRQKIAASPFTPDAVEVFDPGAISILSGALARRAANFSANVPPLSPPPFLPDWNVIVLFHGTPEIRARYQVALRQFALQEGMNLSGDIAATAFAAIRHLRDASRVPVIFKITQLPAKLPELFAALVSAAAAANLPHAIAARGLGVVYFALLREDPLKHLDQLQVQAGLDHQDMEPIVAAANLQAIAELSTAAKSIFAVCARQSANVQIQFCPTALKSELSVLGPPRGDGSAMRRLKSAFDPQNIFAPARLLPAE